MDGSVSRLVLPLLRIAALVYLLLCGCLLVFQRSLIYFPQPRSLASDLLELPIADAPGKVLVSVRPHPGPRALIYFGGNAEDVSQNLPGFSSAFPDYAIYLLNYRSYGGSSGDPSEAALLADGLALFDRVHAGHRDVVVIGRSLGSGIAIRLASLRPILRLVLVTPYDSLQELAAGLFPYLPVRWLLRDKYESWRYAAQVTAPTLLVAAGHDEIVPRASTELLASRFASGRAVLRVVPGTDHNTIADSARFLPLLRDGR